MPQEKLNTKGCSPNSGLYLSESEVCLREMPQLGRENCFWCQLQWQENQAGNRLTFIRVFDNLKPLEKNWTYDVGFPKCYSSVTQVSVYHIWFVRKDQRLHLTHRIMWDGHFQAHTDTDIRVLVPLLSFVTLCCGNNVMGSWKAGNTQAQKE